MALAETDEDVNLTRAKESVKLLDAQIKELQPSLASIAEYVSISDPCRVFLDFAIFEFKAVLSCMTKLTVLKWMQSQRSLLSSRFCWHVTAHGWYTCAHHE